MHRNHPFHCSYFHRVARLTLWNYFAGRGLELSDTRSGGLKAAGPDAFVEMTYFSDNAPVRMELMVNIGSGSKLVPAWFIIGDSPARDPSVWVFTSESELAASLRRIERDVLVPYFDPLMSDGATLADWLGRFERHLEEERGR
jgi:hypothetical protein